MKFTGLAKVTRVALLFYLFFVLVFLFFFFFTAQIHVYSIITLCGMTFMNLALSLSRKIAFAFYTYACICRGTSENEMIIKNVWKIKNEIFSFLEN